MSDEKPTLDFGWLVEKRCDVQRLLLRLLNFGRGGHLEGRVALRAVFEALIGISFALWRTVFLIDPERDRNKVSELGLVFLERLVRDNAVAYAQERDAREWSVGYYLNDAYLRLRLLNEIRTAHSVPIGPKQQEPVDTYFSALVQNSGVTTPLREEWTKAYQVAELVLQDLEQATASTQSAA